MPKHPHGPVDPIVLPKRKGIRGPVQQQVRVTPAMARVWIGFGGGRAKVDPAKVDKLAGIMKRGEWVDHHPQEQWIWFDKAGKLIDGEHRLRAIVKSDVTVTCWVHNKPWLP